MQIQKSSGIFLLYVEEEYSGRNVFYVISVAFRIKKCLFMRFNRVFMIREIDRDLIVRESQEIRTGLRII